MSADNWGTCPRCATKNMLREDWEVGIYGDELFISYAGECRSCDFDKRFKHTENVS